MKTILFAILFALSIGLLVSGCGGGGEKGSKNEEELVEIGRRQWKEDYYGDNREITPEEALKASKRASAYAIMRNIFAAEQRFFAENERYTTDYGELGIERPVSENYTFTLQVLGPGRLRITATGDLDDDKNREYIRMNSVGEIEIIDDDIRDWRETDNVYESPDRPVQKARDAEKKIKDAYERRMRDVPPEYEGD